MSETHKEAQIQEGKLFAIISYISFLCIISLVLKKDNEFVIFHAKQGLVLFVFEVGIFIISIIPIFGFLGTLGIVAFGLASLWQILQVLMGNHSRLPFVADIADNIVL